jgi:multidrug efflux pump
MAFTDLFIKRPVLAIVVSALLLMLGIQAATQLQVRQFPELERGLIRVTTVYPGASAGTVQGFVTAPLQRRIASARGVEYMTSESNPGVSTILVHTRLGENTSEVLTEVIAKMNEARFELPRDVEDPVTSTSQGGDALMYIPFVSQEMSIAQVSDYLLRVVQPEMSTVDGVGKAEILDQRFLAMRVWLDPTRMAAYGVTAEDVDQAIRRENYISSAGTTRGKLVRASVDADTDLSNPAQFASIVVRQQDERRVLLGDVADLELSEEDEDSASFANGQESVFMKISTAPDANPLEVARDLKALLPELNAAMPADLKGTIEFDATMFIDEALFEVSTTLAEAVVIVILVIYLFLGSIRVVLIPLVAIPLSLIGVLFLMNVLGFSINLLTLLAMVIAIGLVVDDAIVVVENVHRYIEEGESPMQAALKGARQVALPVVAMTLTLAAVYAPIAFLGGLTGVLFTEFAMTLAGAVVVSGIIALTLSPMMCSRVLSDHDHQGRFADWLDRVFTSLRNRYQALLHFSLDNRGAVLLFSMSIIASLPLLFQLAQKELAPEEDSGIIFNISTPPSYANLDYLRPFIEQMTDLRDKYPEIDSVFQIASPNYVFGGLDLKTWSERDITQQELQKQVQKDISEIAGMQIFTFGEPALPGSDGGLPVNFVLSSTADYSVLREVAEDILADARKSGLFIFINQSLEYNRPEITVNIDRDKAARLGISMQSIGTTLAVMLGNSETNRFSMEGRSYKVIPQASRDFRLTREWLQRFYLRTSSGELVPLSTVITLGNRVEPKVLSQYQQLNSTTLQGLVMPPNTLGTALEYLEQKTRELAPNHIRVDYEGESLRYKQESQSFALLFGASLLVIYLVLAAQFNGFRDPFIVLISVPMSIFGAVVPLALGFATLNIYTQVGLLTLIGLISKHGILIVDFANQLVSQGQSRHDAVLESASLRLRPILMTTFATVLGVVPLLLASGAGANSRFSIGLMIAAGMLVGTLFTLFVVPVFYMPFGKERKLAEPMTAPLAEPKTEPLAEPQ